MVCNLCHNTTSICCTALVAGEDSQIVGYCEACSKSLGLTAKDYNKNGLDLVEYDKKYFAEKASRRHQQGKRSREGYEIVGSPDILYADPAYTKLDPDKKMKGSYKRPKPSQKSLRGSFGDRRNMGGFTQNEVFENLLEEAASNIQLPEELL